MAQLVERKKDPIPRFYSVHRRDEPFSFQRSKPKRWFSHAFYRFRCATLRLFHGDNDIKLNSEQSLRVANRLLEPPVEPPQAFIDAIKIHHQSISD